MRFNHIACNIIIINQVIGYLINHNHNQLTGYLVHHNHNQVTGYLVHHNHNRVTGYLINHNHNRVTGYLINHNHTASSVLQKNVKRKENLRSLKLSFFHTIVILKMTL